MLGAGEDPPQAPRIQCDAVGAEHHPTDVAVQQGVAGGFGGGGHIRAAGCTIELPIAEARETLVKAVP